MKHEIIDNKYVIYNSDGKIIFSVELTEEPNNQVIIKVNNEVYAGPIDFINFN